MSAVHTKFISEPEDESGVLGMDKAVYLVSGGIDSPAAAYLGIKRGWSPLFVYFDNYPFTGKDTEERALSTVKKIKSVTGVEGEVLIVPHGRDLDLFVKGRRNLTCLLCKRMMYRKAERIASDHGCKAIVTGEILGEQASQTLRNLILNSAVINTPIIRPLIGMNKREVEGIARSIGTLEISATKAQDCTAASIKARTRARAEELEQEECGIPLCDLVEESIKGLRRVVVQP